MNTQEYTLPLNRPGMSKRLLCISYHFPPDTWPTAIQVGSFLESLPEDEWTVDVITAAEDAVAGPHVNVHRIEGRTKPGQALGVLRQWHLGKVANLLAWPDGDVFWVVPALAKALQLVRRHRPDAVAVFMMPSSAGLAGVLLKKLTGLPLVLSLDDSPTCSDMNPYFPTRLHYRMTRWLEDLYVRSADAIIYVSERNLRRVRARQPEEQHDTFHLIRLSARRIEEEAAEQEPQPANQGEGEEAKEPDLFRIVYTGGTGGWYQFQDGKLSPSLLERLYQRWQGLGHYQHAALDHRSHGPVFIGEAVKRVLRRHPEWEGRLRVEVYGNRYPEAIEQHVLADRDLTEIVRLHDTIPHQEALRRIREADLLFMALPDREDGSPGGRISLKTYEYLATDRPILAALPPGENRTYLQGKPGVHLTDPKDDAAMEEVVETLAARAFSGQPIDVDRSSLKPALMENRRTTALKGVFERVIAKEGHERP